MVWTKPKTKFVVHNYLFPNKNARPIDWKTNLRKNWDGTLERPRFMKIKKRGALTKPEKKVVAKAMYDAGWGTKHLSQWFKVGPPTILKWDKIPTPDALKEFEQTFKAAMLDYDMEGTFKIKNKIMQLIPEEKDINKLVKAGEFFSGEKDKRTTQTNTQVNIYGDMLKKYGTVTVLDKQ